MLTDTFLRSLKPADKPKKYADGGGLFIYVSTTGSKLWRMAYRFNMKSKLLSFGEYPLVSLKEAREQRDEAKKLLAKDIDPGQHKKELQAARIAEEADTFRAVALEWYETRQPTILPPTAVGLCSIWKNTCSPRLAERP